MWKAGRRQRRDAGLADDEMSDLRITIRRKHRCEDRGLADMESRQTQMMRRGDVDDETSETGTRRRKTLRLRDGVGMDDKTHDS